MIHFRFHKGSLTDSLASEITGETPRDIITQLRQSAECQFADIDTLICRFYGNETRCEALPNYRNTFIVSANLKGRRHEPPVVIGFCSHNLNL